LVGVLTLYTSQRDAFTEDHRRVIEVIAKQVSPALKRAVEEESSPTRNVSDQLSGLPSLQHLQRFIAAELFGATGPSALSIILVDLMASRKGGKIVDDLVLGKAADCIRRALRAGDILFRYGDEAFVVLLSQTGPDAAVAVAQRIAKGVSDKGFGPASADDDRIVATLGVATAPIDGITIEPLVAAARQRDKPAAPGSPMRPSIH
jgi:diguanylate cyclase (GGDEF)-like protein